MRKRFLFALLFLLSVSFACGQEKKGDPELLNFPMFIEVGGGFTPRQNGITSISPYLTVGYEAVPRLSVIYVLEGTLALKKHDDHKYSWANGMGGGLSFRMFHFGKRDQVTKAETDAVDVRAFFTSTYGRPGLKYTTYNVMLMDYDYRGKGRIKMNMYVGVGYRYVDSHTLGVKNTHNVYFSFGFR